MARQQREHLRLRQCRTSRSRTGAGIPEGQEALYAHVLEAPLGPLPLTGLVPERIGAVRRLADGGEVVRGESWVTNAYENLAFVTFGTIPQYTYPLPDPIDTVPGDRI